MRVTPHWGRANFALCCASMRHLPSDYVKSGTHDEIEGTIKSLGGKLEEGVGKVVGSPRLESKGDSDHFEGKAQKKIGEIKKVFAK